MTNLTIGVVGNPNCGKTTLFNAFTGARQRTGNWSGVTVERKSGTYEHAGNKIDVVDLPGVYSLGVVPGMDSMDETIGRDFILSGEPDVIVNIVDVGNLERNLYLTAQLIEMRVPMVVALNMMDAAARRGIEVDAEHLAEHLGVPVVPLIASKGRGVDALKEAIRETAARKTIPTAAIPYAAPVEKAADALMPMVSAKAAEAQVDPRWLAVKLLEGDDLACRMVAGTEGCETSKRLISTIEDEADEDPDTLIADGRYGFVNFLARHVVKKRDEATSTTSDAIDRIVLNRWFGLPIFLGVIYLLFMFTINLGGAFIDFFDIAAGTLFIEGFGALLEAVGVPVWLKVILADGIGGGIQVVATFIPIIGFLYLFLSFLEDSGYMARAAFLMDRFMRVIGLPGKAFVPLIVGFGCNVPAVMATRSLERKRDRTMSVLMAPFMSCGARLAVYALFAAAFFPTGGQNVVFALYLIGIAVAILTGLALKHTLLRGETSPFMMELPSYHTPQAKGILIHTWSRLKSFVVDAGQVIVVVVTVLTFLNSWGTDGSFGNEDSERSVLSTIGKAMVPAFAPLGIEDDNWPATVGIFTGIFAKEAVVGTLNALYSGLAEAGGPAGTDEPFDLLAGLGRAVASIPENLSGLADLALDPLGLDIGDVSSVEAAAEAQEVETGTFGAMAARFDGRAGAFAYLLFILLYIPCVAALGAINRELGARWTTFSALWTTGAAYGISILFYQGATFARHPASSATWITAMLTVLVVTLLAMRAVGRRTHPGIPAPVGN